MQIRSIAPAGSEPVRALRPVDSTLTGMEVRGASNEDCGAIAQVHVASWQAAYAEILDPAFLANLSIAKREETWRQTLAQGGCDVLVASVDSSVVGFASFGRSRDADASPETGELWALYVHPSAWSSGAGRALWLAAQSQLRAKGFRSVSLWVLARNAPAIRFYAAAGFQVEAGSEKMFELGGRSVAEVRMVHAG